MGAWLDHFLYTPMRQLEWWEMGLAGFVFASILVTFAGLAELFRRVTRPR